MFTLGLLNCIYRADFPTTTIGFLLIVLMIIDTDMNDMKKFIQWIIYGVIILIVIDFFWIIMVSTRSSYDDEEATNENTITTISFVSSCVNIIVKIVLIGVLLLQKNQIK